MRQKIIITRDNSSSFERLKRELEKKGFEVFVVRANGEELVSALKAETPNVLVMDAFMEKFDALFVLETFGRQFKKAGTTVFIKAALKNRRFEKMILEKGADAFLLKPVSAEDLTGEKVTLKKSRRKRKLSFSRI